MPGLCLRIYPSGARTSRAMPRDADGIQRRVSFKPRYPLLRSLEDAPARARTGDAAPTGRAAADAAAQDAARHRQEGARGLGSAASWRPRRRRSERTLKRVSGRRCEPFFALPYHRLSSAQIQQMIDARKVTRARKGTAAWLLHGNLGTWSAGHPSGTRPTTRPSRS